MGIRKVGPEWHRLQSLKPRSPPKVRRPLWQVAQVCPRVVLKCWAGFVALTCRVCGAPAVSLWQSAQASRSRVPWSA